MKSLILFCSLALTTIFNSSLAQKTISADGLVGTWMVADGTAKVKIEKSGSKFVGKIVWMNPPTDKHGNPVLDTHNKDKALQSRTIMNLPMLQDFVYDGDGVWINGTIYDPDEGETYSCKITMNDNQSINVRGYVGISLFGRTETWKRCSDDASAKQNAALKVGK